jgi:hypothetical protein
MSWTDRQSIKVINYLKDKYKIKSLVETGTFMGVNAELHAKNFEKVYTCEKVEEYYNKSLRRLGKYSNIRQYKVTSPDFLKFFNNTDETLMFYLDAHFYDKNLENKFVITEELESLLERSAKSVIAIHDFDNGLGHINYDGQPLNLDLIGKYLEDYNLYTNHLASCDIVKLDEIKESNLNVDEETYGNLIYAWKEPRLTYRGILYCLPDKLSKKEMDKLGLKEWN